MQKQNHISIDYLENPVRFADLINGYIYHGQERIKPTDISELSGAVTRIDDRKKSRRQLRTQVITADVMRRVSDGMQVAVVALENQTDIHYAMPVRVMNLEGSCYHRQWSLRKKMLTT